MHPILGEWSVGDASLRIGSYGLFLTIAVFAALAVFTRELGRLGVRPSEGAAAGIVLVLAGLAGAKLLGISVERTLGSATSLTQSGGAIHGGVIGGALGTVWIARRLRRPLARVLDAAVVAVAVGQGLGRFGCFLAGCCWGVRYDGPGAVTFTSEVAHRLTHVPLDVPLFPVQLVDGVAHLALAFVLGATPRRAGRRAALYFGVEGALRMALESLRGDASRGVWGEIFTTGRITSAFLSLAGLALFVVMRSKVEDDPTTDRSA